MSNPRVNFPTSRPTQSPSRPTNALHDASNAVATVVAAPMKPVEMLNEGFAKATNFISNMLPTFPAATLLSVAMGAPHAHVAHPPSGPPPVPPTPLPPIGPVMFGTCVSVLINGKPAARCGDLGLGPTCCGLPPIYEIFTGSSKVFIGGARAARQLDITYHCKPVPPAGAAARGAAAALQTAMKAAMIAGMAAQVASAAGDAIEASNPANSPAMQAAMGMSASVAAAQLANDLVALAMGALMGKDPCVPPGTPGAIMLNTSPNVQIGGFPMPSWMAIAKGLLKLVKGLRARRNRGRKKANENACASEAQPINLVTGAYFDYFVDYELDGPIPFVVRRYYDSRWHRTDGPFGCGFRHEYQYTLRATLDGFDLVMPDNEVVSFPPLEKAGQATACQGFLLRRLERKGTFAIMEAGRPTMTFDLADERKSSPLRSLQLEKASMNFRYDREGNLTSIHYSTGRQLRFTYERNHVVQILLIEPDAKDLVLASYVYDRAGLLIGWKDAMGHLSTYYYDENQRMIKRTNRRGYSFHNEYDSEGRCTREYGEDGLWDASVQYIPEARCAVCTYADGATSTVFYDENQIPIETIEPSGGKTVFELNDEGDIVLEKDPLGNTTEWLYNEWGGHISRVDPLGYIQPPMDVEPNPHDPLTYLWPETPLEWEHGTLLNRNRITKLSGRDPLLLRSPASVYNVVLRGLRSESGGGEPDAINGSQKIPSKIFDRMGRVLEEADEDGRTQRWKYDPEGNVIEYHDRDGSIYRWEYKSWNLLEKEIDPTGGVTSYDYNLRMEVTKVTDPNGTVSKFVYDHWDRLVEVNRHGQVRERYKYDLADNLVAKTNGTARPLLNLDILPGNLKGNRVLAGSGEAPKEEQKFEYDEAGRITLAATDTMEVTRAFDARGRLLKDHRDGLGIDHVYVASQLTATLYFQNFKVSYERSENRTLKIIDPTGKVHSVRISSGGLVERELSSGRKELAAYDRQGRCLHKAGINRWDRKVDWRMSFRYSGEGDLLEVENSSEGKTQYSYDAAHRLRSETLPDGEASEFLHNIGNNLIKQPGLDQVELLEGNRLRSANGEAFDYNDRNHISRRHRSGQDVQYVYDDADRLIGCTISGESWSAVYDPLCRRVTKTWKGQTTTYYWDDSRLTAEERPDGVLRLYVYADESSLVPFLFVEYANREADPNSGICYFVFTNHIGVPIRVEDDRTKVVWQARVTPYGQVNILDHSQITMPLRFPGHYHDVETGLHYNRFRYYDPVLGRYIQSDPLGLEGGVNLYSYSTNPLVEVDLSGLARHNPRRSRRKGASAEGPDAEKPPRSREEAAAARRTVEDQIRDVRARRDQPPPLRHPNDAERVPQRDVVDSPPPGAEPPDVPRPNQRYPLDHLPTGGDHPYVPRRQAGNPEITFDGETGQPIDNRGNRWEWARDQHAGPHWDVQHRDGTHTNVYPDGMVHQGDDNF